MHELRHHVRKTERGTMKSMKIFHITDLRRPKELFSLRGKELCMVRTIA